MNAVELIRLHLELECIGLSPEGLLVRIPGPDPDDIPRLYAARHADGVVAYCRHDQPPEVRAVLAQLPPDTAFDDPATVTSILAQHAPVQAVWQGKSYVFPEPPSPAACPQTVRLGAEHHPLIQAYAPGMDVDSRAVFAVIVAGQIVSTCESSRENGRAGEAWVQTLPAFRGRGYARQVTLAWAHDLQQRSKLPFYSHRSDNLASQALARGLGLRQYVADVAYE